MSHDSLEQAKVSGMCPHMNFPDRCETCRVEQESGVDLESAMEILGRENVFGPERVKEVFGVKVEAPKIPFSKEDLERARENGERLILRIDRLDPETPLTINNLVHKIASKGARLFSRSSDVSDELDWVEGMVFQEERTPGLEWKLIWTKPLYGVRHLSSEAQQAFIRSDRVRLESSMEEMKLFWHELLKESENEWLRESIEKAEADLPSIDDLIEIRSQLPESSRLPSTVEAIYDAMMIGGAPFDRMSVITDDVVEPFEDEPERPLDISFTDGEVSLHVRRDTHFGRPHKLGQGNDFVSGIPIGYIQY
jgi:hypothetical protein